MRRSLLDVNVLLALLDADHGGFRRAREWMESSIDAGWASCALTENGFARIISQQAYPRSQSTSTALAMLRRACETEYHEFWPCDLSVVDPAVIDASRVHGPKQLTDVYLLALSVAHGGRFVTFDRSVPLSAVPSATGEHLVVL